MGGWDGRYGYFTAIPPTCVEYMHSIRLYATRTLKPLGTLKYHKTNCQVVEFARSADIVANPTIKATSEDEESDDEISERERLDRTRWLVGGGKDNRVSIWSLMSFQKT